MATLKDIKFSLEGEQQNSAVQEEIAQIALSEAPDGTEVKYVIFKLLETNKSGGVYIPTIDDVIHPETGKMERIRLLSGVESIWMKDQKGLSEEYVKQNVRSIHFPRGMRFFRVPDWDGQLLEFMRITRHNVKSKNRVMGSRFEFFEYDPAAQQKEALEREELELEMAIKAKQMPYDEVLKIASFLGIRFNDDMGQVKTEEGIRRELMIRAKQQPKEFQRLLGSKEVDLAFTIRKAIVANKIDLNKEPGNAWWSTGKFICKVPKDEVPLRYLTQLAMTNTEEGREFLNNLQVLG